MSRENRPNLHAVGLLTDIIKSLETRIRGKAGEAGMKEVLPLLSDEINSFINEIDLLLDEKYGGPTNECNNDTFGWNG
jgi:hypothetical protein